MLARKALVAMEVVMCVPQSDVSLTQTVSNDQPAIGDTVTITLTVNNAAGGDMTTGLQVTDSSLPAGLNFFVSANPEQGTYDNNTGVWHRCH
ncbi:MAG: DUF11 domain-containing protein [Thiolinea sp.]